MQNAPRQKTNHILNWRTLCNLTVLSACFYASMEWLFFATKPSSLSILSTLDSVKVLFVTTGTVALLSIVLLILVSIPAWITKQRSWLVIGSMIPALILSITALIMLDNFTYTVFKFGIVSSHGFRRGVYAVMFLVFLWRMIELVRHADWAHHRMVSSLSLGLLAVSFLVLVANRLGSGPDLSFLMSRSANSSVRYPNIIILGSDGLSDSYLTAYGSSLNTTPFLNELAKKSLVVENAFPNAGSTTASTTSALTGKLPLMDKVYHYPDVLAGADSFEHLPGLLRQRGYRTIEVGTPHYVDARRLNMLEGFDRVNNQSLSQPALEALIAVLGNSPSTYFLQTIAARASERLLHIFFIRQMENPLQEVNDPTVRVSDEERVDQILEALDHSDRPVFVFVHLMDTHGPEFSFQKDIFSGSPNADIPWDPSRYRDAIYSFDNHLKKIYDHLAQTGQLDRTILVIYTDHGFQYATHERIPIIIHFPHDANIGLRHNNIQIVDIPVTLLNYLGLQVPAWMHGVSFLHKETPATREIITTTAGSPNEVVPPFYQINTVQVIVCQKWYELNVRKNTFDSGLINGHTAPCDENLLPPGEQIRQKILEELEKYGYEISSLQ